MAQNIFNATFDANNRIDVNSFDWSHVNNLTTDFGRITPTFCKLVPAKGSVRINPEFGLELMPMVFPCQTRMFARMNFFKVPLRTLWDDYRDFIGNFREDLEEPYIGKPSNWSDLFSTGGLADYLDFPTQYLAPNSTPAYHIAQTFPPTSSTAVYGKPLPFSDAVTLYRSGYPNSSVPEQSDGFVLAFYSTIGTLPKNSSDTDMLSFLCSLGNTGLDTEGLNAHFFIYPSTSSSTPIGTRPVFEASTKTVKVSTPGDILVNITVPWSTFLAKGSQYRLVLLVEIDVVDPNITRDTAATFEFYNLSISQTPSVSTFPFATRADSTLPRLLAYRFRAYEACYNAYYRDIRNNPFIVNGKPVYNKWLPTTAGGIDNYAYTLHKSNWEKDAYTTAVPNPQQGQTLPLVGLVTGDVVTTSDTGERVVQKQVVLSTEDGGKYGLRYKTNEDGTALTGVEYEPLSDKTPITAINSYSDLAALATQSGTGFTIETLRYVNAYQKFLELNMRKGFSYKQIMEGRFDVNIKFDELLMPEFIGGISRELSMRTVEQTVDQQSDSSQGKYAEALGSKTGIAGVYGYSDNTIECFCDEESIIIGLLTVVPVPIYSQLLPKDWTYNGLLDHFQPEFDRIGFQPITYKELCPLNVVGNSESEINQQLNRVFGYQRPWHEYVAQYDTSHGNFRSDMSSFIMQRLFKGLPELSKDFLLVDNETVNQVFSVTEFTDKIFGYVKFNCTARLPISRVAIPRLD